MTITLAERERIIKKMDEQFESDLRMRKESNLCGQKAASTYKQLSLLQKVNFLFSKSAYLSRKCAILETMLWISRTRLDKMLEISV